MIFIEVYPFLYFLKDELCSTSSFLKNISRHIAQYDHTHLLYALTDEEKQDVYSLCTVSKTNEICNLFVHREYGIYFKEFIRILFGKLLTDSSYYYIFLPLNNEYSDIFLQLGFRNPQILNLQIRLEYQTENKSNDEELNELNDNEAYHHVLQTHPALFNCIFCNRYYPKIQGVLCSWCKRNTCVSCLDTWRKRVQSCPYCKIKYY